MKRNKYWEKEKNYLRLCSALADNRDAQYNLGYVPLEKPIHRGYIASFDLLPDISRRQDAWVFKYILKICGRDAWRRKNDFHESQKKLKKDFWKWADEEKYFQYPSIAPINESSYNGLPEQVRKWFSQYITHDSWGSWKKYYCNVPTFYWDIKVDKHYDTEVKVIDNVLLQEEAELEQKLLSVYNHKWWRGKENAPKSFRRFYHRSDRLRSKHEIHKIVRDGKDESKSDFPMRHRHSATWDYW